MQSDVSPPVEPTFGSGADVAWIRDATCVGLDITSAIPPIFEAYATILAQPGDGDGQEHPGSLLRLLRTRSTAERWWLGYLDTGPDDKMFPLAPRVTLYANWSYVVVLAGPDDAMKWRFDTLSWRRGPDIAFPFDRSWLLSRLWDDDWHCLGGPSTLIDAILADARFDTRQVQPGEDATPPGQVAR